MKHGTLVWNRNEYVQSQNIFLKGGQMTTFVTNIPYKMYQLTWFDSN